MFCRGDEILVNVAMEILNYLSKFIGFIVNKSEMALIVVGVEANIS